MNETDVTKLFQHDDLSVTGWFSARVDLKRSGVQSTVSLGGVDPTGLRELHTAIEKH